MCVPVVYDFGFLCAAMHLLAQALQLSARLQAQHGPWFGAAPAMPPSQRTATQQSYRHAQRRNSQVTTPEMHHT
jgi:hypothetical protein